MTADFPVADTLQPNPGSTVIVDVLFAAATYTEEAGNHPSRHSARNCSCHRSALGIWWRLAAGWLQGAAVSVQGQRTYGR